MTRIRFGAALALLLAVGAVASAQPGKPPGVIQFKQFGATPEQFFQSSVTRWTSELALSLEAIRADVAAAKLPAAARASINAQVENSLAQTLELDHLVRRGAGKDKLHAAFADVDRAVAALTTALNQNPPAKAAAAPAIARTDTAFHQLSGVLGGGDSDPARLKRRLMRLGDVIDDNAEELRNLVSDQIGGTDRALERALGQFAREARLLSRRVRDDADPELVKRTYATMGERWADSLNLLGKARVLPPVVQAQAFKVDGLHRRLGSVMSLPPFPPGTDPRLPAAKRLSFAIGAVADGGPVVVYSDERGTLATTFYAYDKTFDGGARVDMADLNGDGVPELIVAPGPSKGKTVQPVKVFDGRDYHLLIEFVPVPNWTGGLRAVGTDLTKDGRALIAVTTDGVPAVKVFDLAQGKEVASFFAHDFKTVTGGVRLAWGDVNGDGVPDILTINGPGNTVTTVKVFNGKNTEVLAEFPAVDDKYKGGGYIAAADLAGSGRANPVVGLDAGTIPLVRVFDARGKAQLDFFPYDEKFKGGVRVGVSARTHLVTAPGPGLKNSPVRVFDLARPKIPLGEILPFPGFDGGLEIGGR